METNERTMQKVSYWNIVWVQFKKNKPAYFSLWALIILYLIAIYAPVVSLNKPFYIITEQGTEFPFFTSLFDRNFFENGVDIFFNVSMFIFPLWFIGYLIFSDNRKNVVLFCLSIQLLAFIWFMVIKPVKLPYTNYKRIIHKYETEGKQISYLFPILKYSFREVNEDNPNPQPPDKIHWAGTDTEGRDVFTRMLYGTRISLTIGVVAVSIYITIGIIIGSIAGYYGGWTDILISRFIEIMMTFPTFFLILTLAAFIEERSIFHVMLIIGLTRWTPVARLIRGEVLREKNKDYCQAAIALGFPNRRVIFGHIFPNAMAPVLVSAAFGVASAILTESSLSFLGLGDPSAPSWGQLLNTGRVREVLWLILTPGVAIFFVVSILNIIGDGLRDALDPKLRK